MNSVLTRVGIISRMAASMTTRLEAVLVSSEVRIHQVSNESLILAQNQRWRRA